MFNKVSGFASRTFFVLTFIVAFPHTGFITRLIPSSTDFSLINIAFVNTLYNDLLGRSPNGIELNAALAFLTTNPRSILAQELLLGSEYRSDLVQKWYQHYLGRPATSPEVAFALDLFNSYTPDESVQAYILGLPEYYSNARRYKHGLLNASLRRRTGTLNHSDRVEYLVGVN